MSLYFKDFDQFRKDVLSRLNANYNSASVSAFKGCGLFSIFSSAAKNDNGTNDKLFEYENENQYKDLIQKGIELLAKQSGKENEYSAGRAIKNFWKGFTNAPKNLWNNIAKVFS